MILLIKPTPSKSNQPNNNKNHTPSTSTTPTATKKTNKQTPKSKPLQDDNNKEKGAKELRDEEKIEMSKAALEEQETADEKRLRMAKNYLSKMSELDEDDEEISTKLQEDAVCLFFFSLFLFLYSLYSLRRFPFRLFLILYVLGQIKGKAILYSSSIGMYFQLELYLRTDFSYSWREK